VSVLDEMFVREHPRGDRECSASTLDRYVRSERYGLLAMEGGPVRPRLVKHGQSKLFVGFVVVLTSLYVLFHYLR